MSKKHFIALADSIREHNRCAVNNRQYTAFTSDQIEMLADHLKRENSNFMRVRWLGYVAGNCGPNGGELKKSK